MFDKLMDKKSIIVGWFKIIDESNLMVIRGTIDKLPFSIYLVYLLIGDFPFHAFCY
jgi:hypothetical protein